MTQLLDFDWLSSIADATIWNMLFVLLLAAIVTLITRIWKSSTLAHALWMLVLLKVVTPPFFYVPIARPILSDQQEATTNQRFAESRRNELRNNDDRVPLANRIGVSELERSRFGSSSVSAISDSSDPYLSEEQREALGGLISSDQWLGSDEMDFEPTDEGRLADQLASREAHSFAKTRSSGEGSSTPIGIIGSVERTSLVVCFSIWLAGSCLLAIRFFVRTFRFQRIVSSSKRADAIIIDEVQRIAHKYQLRKAPETFIVDAQIPPLIWCAGIRPKLVLPKALLADLSDSERETILAHELAHVRRRDYLVRWLEFLVVVGFWWNPIVWWARLRLRQAEEHCCDAWVVWTMPNHRRTYGRALLRTVEFLTDDRTMIAVGTSMGRFVVRPRIEKILNQKTEKSMSRSAVLSVVVIGLLVLPLGAAPWYPQDIKTQPGENRSESDTSEIKLRPAASQDVDEEKEAMRRKIARLESMIEHLLAEAGQDDLLTGEFNDELDREDLADIRNAHLQALGFLAMQAQPTVEQVASDAFAADFADESSDGLDEEDFVWSFEDFDNAAGIATSRNGSFVAVVEYVDDNHARIRLIKSGSGELLMVMEARGEVVDVGFSNEGETLGVLSGDSFSVFDPATGERTDDRSADEWREWKWNALLENEAMDDLGGLTEDGFSDSADVVSGFAISDDFEVADDAVSHRAEQQREFRLRLREIELRRAQLRLESARVRYEALSQSDAPEIERHAVAIEIQEAELDVEHAMTILEAEREGLNIGDR